MNKTEFMKELAAHLSQIDADERAEAVAFYSEYFDEAGVENEQLVIKELGSPAQVAAQIKADAAVKEMQAEAPPVKKGVSAIWMVILGIIALPVAFPFIILALSLTFAFLILAATLIFTLVVFVGALLFAGFVITAAGIEALLYDAAVGIFYIGLGFTTIGVSTFMAACVLVAAQAVVIGSVKLINYIRVKIQKKHSSKTANKNGEDPNA